jgi:hypothetical protein
MDPRIAELVREIKRGDIDAATKNVFLVELGNRLFAASTTWSGTMMQICTSICDFARLHEVDVRLWLANNSHILVDRCFSSPSLNHELGMLIPFITRCVDGLMGMLYDVVPEITRASIASATVIHSTCWALLRGDLQVQRAMRLTARLDNQAIDSLTSTMHNFQVSMYHTLSLHHQRNHLSRNRTPTAISQLQAIKFFEKLLLDRLQYFCSMSRISDFLPFLSFRELAHDNNTVLSEIHRFLTVSPYPHLCSVTLVGISFLTRMLFLCSRRPSPDNRAPEIVDHLEAMSKQITQTLIGLYEALVPNKDQPPLLFASNALNKSTQYAFIKAFTVFLKYPFDAMCCIVVVVVVVVVMVRVGLSWVGFLNYPLEYVF